MHQGIKFPTVPTVMFGYGVDRPFSIQYQGQSLNALPPGEAIVAVGAALAPRPTTLYVDVFADGSHSTGKTSSWVPRTAVGAGLYNNPHLARVQIPSGSGPVTLEIRDSTRRYVTCSIPRAPQPT